MASENRNNAAPPHEIPSSPSGSAARPKAEEYPTPALGPEDFNSAVLEDGGAALPTYAEGERSSRSMSRFTVEYEPGGIEPMVDIRRLAEALRISIGNIAEAARILQDASGVRISRSYVSQRISKEPLLGELVAELRETILDYAEDNIRLKVQLGDAEASKFLLKTLGRGRGYQEPRKEDDKTLLDATAADKLQAMEDGRKRARDARAKAEGITQRKIVDITPQLEKRK